MTVVTTRPDATNANGGSTVTGAATRHAALADSSDSSYVTLPNGGGAVSIGFADPTIPAGAILNYYFLRARVAKTGSDAFLEAPVPSGGFPLYPGSVLVTWASAANVYLHGDRLARTDPAVLSASAGDLRLYELWSEANYVAKPVAAVTAPTGSVTDTNLPTVAWTNTLDADGDAQTFHETRIFTSAQYGAGGFNPASSTAAAESGVIGDAATSWRATTPLPNGTYRAYHRSAQTVGGNAFWSDWVYGGFTIATTPPNAPAFTLTADADNGRVVVVLDDAATGATTDYFQVERQDGAGWVRVRSLTDADGTILPSSGAATVYDYEAPNGVEATYRARAFHNYELGAAASAWTTHSVTWTSGAWWVKHPTIPALNLNVRPSSQAASSRPSRVGVFQPLGTSSAIVVSDVRGARTGPLTIGLDTDADRDALDALVDAESAVFIQGTADDHWRDRWVRIFDLESNRHADVGWVAESLESFTWVEVARPPGAIQAWPA